MATLIVMPKLSPTMEEGVLLKWTKKEGDRIQPGDVIAEVETDKANMDFPLEDEGTLLKLLVAEGETIKLGAPVAVLGEPGESLEAAMKQLGSSAGPSKVVASTAGGETARPQDAAALARAATAPTTRPALARPPLGKPATGKPGMAKPAMGKPGIAKPTMGKPAIAKPTMGKPAMGKPGMAKPATGKPGMAKPAMAKPGMAAQRPLVPAEGGRTKASPLARKVAVERGVDLRLVRGSGPGGRVVLRDVAEAPVRPPQALPRPGVAATARPAPAKPAHPAQLGRADETRPLSQMRKTVARRITEAKQTVPHFYLTMDASSDALWTAHQQLKQALGETQKVSINDLIVKATAIALTQVPSANASFSDAGIVRHGRVDVGIAVAMEDGLITPVVRDADRKSVGSIARETQDLIARARQKRLRPDEYTGATFSVSNLGMYGVREFSAIINPPESGILAVGALEKRAVAVTDAWGIDRLEIHRVMTLTMSCDHRVVDGALGAELLRAIVRILERPFALVL